MGLRSHGRIAASQATCEWSRPYLMKAWLETVAETVEASSSLRLRFAMAFGSGVGYLIPCLSKNLVCIIGVRVDSRTNTGVITRLFATWIKPVIPDTVHQCHLNMASVCFRQKSANFDQLVPLGFPIASWDWLGQQLSAKSELSSYTITVVLTTGWERRMTPCTAAESAPQGPLHGVRRLALALWVR